MENATFCGDEVEWAKLVILPFPLISFLINSLLLLTTAIKRKKLERQNYIYACVISILLSNFFYIIIHVWLVLDNYFGASFTQGKVEKTFWTFIQNALVSVQFIMCGNIGALLFVVLDSTYFVGRSVNRKASEFAKGLRKDDESTGKHRWLAKRCKALSLIALSWLVPLALALVATFVWNCEEECVYCSGGTPIGEVCNSSAPCSLSWPSVRDEYLGVQTALWFLVVVGLLFPIYSGIKSFHEVMAPPTRSEYTAEPANKLVLPNTPNKIARDKTIERSGPVPSIIITAERENSIEFTMETNLEWDDDCSLSSYEGSPYPTPTSSMFSLDSDFEEKEQNKNDANNTPNTEISNNNSLEKEEQVVEQKRSKVQRSFFKLHSRITFMIVISSVFVVCSLPQIICFILNLSKVNIFFEAASYLSSFFIYVYTIVSPLILLKYLPSLKSALVLTVQNCSCSRLSKVYKKKSTIRRMSKSNAFAIQR